MQIQIENNPIEVVLESVIIDGSIVEQNVELNIAEEIIAIDITQEVINLTPVSGVVLVPTAATKPEFVGIAGQNIIAGQVVAFNSAGNLIVASADNMESANRIAGIALGSALINQAINVLRSGLYTTNYTFNIGSAVYLGTAGELVQTHNLGLFQIQLGVAITSSMVFLEIEMPIIKV